MKGIKTVTRRDFLRGTAGLLLGTTLGSMVPSKAKGEEKAKVVLIRNAGVLNPKDEIDQEVLRSMLDEAVQTLVGERQAQRAWQALFKKSDVVGIKSNVWRYLPTPRELEEAIKSRLLDAGIPENNIAVDDRGVLDNPVFQKATALVNVRPVRTHHWSGVGTCLKNYIQFVRAPSTYHGEACSDLGQIWTLPVVKGKTKLNILCALTPQFYGRGASAFDRRYVWQYKGLIVGFDPVAVDSVGAELLRLKRLAHFGEDRALDVPPIHIVVADKKYHLGVSDLSRIQIVKRGWQDDILI